MLLEKTLKVNLKKSEMSDIKNKAQGMEASATPRDIKAFVQDTGNIYESLAIISKRANQLSSQIKRELNNKLEEFASGTDSLEEIHENKEQIEISKFYERLPNPAIIATEEFLEEELSTRYKEGSDADERF